jgi:Zn-dependent peptidase ImmA (M78 family)
MRKLKTITLLGRKIQIIEGKNLVYQNEPCLGLCDYDKRIIYIEKNQSKESKRDTLIHELNHFFMILCGMDQRLAESEIEMYCQLIAAFVVDIKPHV